jgi:hypothetical protein
LPIRYNMYGWIEVRVSTIFKQFVELEKMVCDRSKVVCVCGLYALVEVYVICICMRLYVYVYMYVYVYVYMY